MASENPPLSVILAPAALDDLNEIWEWNAKRYNSVHADLYLRYLKRMIDGLSVTYPKGKVVSMRTDLRYILIKRRAKGHGHVAVYSVDAERIHVLHVFHTSQNWPEKLI